MLPFHGEIKMYIILLEAVEFIAKQDWVEESHTKLLRVLGSFHIGRQPGGRKGFDFHSPVFSVVILHCT